MMDVNKIVKITGSLAYLRDEEVNTIMHNKKAKEDFSFLVVIHKYKLLFFAFQLIFYFFSSQ